MRGEAGEAARLAHCSSLFVPGVRSVICDQELRETHAQQTCACLLPASSRAAALVPLASCTASVQCRAVYRASQVQCCAAQAPATAPTHPIGTLFSCAGLLASLRLPCSRP